MMNIGRGNVRRNGCLQQPQNWRRPGPGFGAKEYETIMANMGQNTSIDTEPVVSVDIQNAPPEAEAAPAVNTVSVIGTEQAQEIVTLRDELVAQEALREKEIKGTKENNRRGETNNGRESSKESSQ